VRIGKPLLDKLLDHAIYEAPQECCGMIGCIEDNAITVYPAHNVAESEHRYEIDGPEQWAILDRMQDAGLTLGGIYHSHTQAPPVPSEMDVATWFYPMALCVIVDARVYSPTALNVFAYRIVDGQVTEEWLR
jgi:proteasome lid subunit RPN8/RPN11